MNTDIFRKTVIDNLDKLIKGVLDISGLLNINIYKTYNKEVNLAFFIENLGDFLNEIYLKVKKVWLLLLSLHSFFLLLSCIFKHLEGFWS